MPDPAIGWVLSSAFASRGYSIDQPLATAPRDLPNTFTDIVAGTILANLCTDAFRSATQADLSFAELLAQSVDATQALNLSAGVWKPKVSRGQRAASFG
jgi:hypothetical protein